MLFVVRESQSPYVALAGLELTVWTRLDLNSETSHLPIRPSAGIIGMCHHTSSALFFTALLLWKHVRTEGNLAYSRRYSPSTISPCLKMSMCDC